MSESCDTHDGSERIDSIFQRAGGTSRDQTATVLAIVYQRLRELASMHMRSQPNDHSLQTTALANEAVVKLLRSSSNEWQGERHILATASQVMRQILIDHARQKNRAKRGGDAERVPLDAIEAPFTKQAVDVCSISDTIERLRSLNECAAQIVEFKFFLGMTMDDIATSLGMSKRSVEREWTTARAWLNKELAKR